MKKQWQRHNASLQRAYLEYINTYNLPSSKRDDALMKIQKELEWPPFAGLISSNSMAFPFSTSRYGLDYETERYISIIDKIAKGEIEY